MKLTVRGRLTLVYGSLFVVAGMVLLCEECAPAGSLRLGE